MAKKLIGMILTVGIVFSLIPALSTQAATTISIGKYVQIGKYNGEPIIWRCVDVDANGPLMLSDKILSIKSFDGVGEHANDFNNFRLNNGSNLWETSNMRTWLNSSATAGSVIWPCGNPPTNEKVWLGYNAYNAEAGFLSDENFSESERNIVKSVTQKSLLNDRDNALKAGGTASHTYNDTISKVLQNFSTTAYYQNITDKMFLLDVQQANRVYLNSTTLGTNYYVGEPTAKAIEKSDYKDSNLAVNTKWQSWLRSPYADLYYPQDVRCVSPNGRIDYYDAYISILGVRPAFYMDLSAVVFKSGDGTANNPYLTAFPGVSTDIIAPTATGTSSGGVTIKVPVNVANIVDQPLNAKLVTALYNVTTNKLCQIKSRLISLNANALMDYEENFSVNSAQGGTYKAKTFLWNGYDTLKPICKTAEKTIALSSNAALSNIQIDGVDLAEFSPNITDYSLTAVGTTIPVVAATAQDIYADVLVTQAPSLNGEATIRVTAQNGSVKTYSVVFAPLTVLFESSHPYASFTDQTLSYTLNEPCTSIKVTFSANTEVELNFDFIYVMDAAGNVIGKYTGTALANLTVTVPGNTVKVRLVSDDSTEAYGYQVVKVKGIQ